MPVEETALFFGYLLPWDDDRWHTPLIVVRAPASLLPADVNDVMDFADLSHPGAFGARAEEGDKADICNLVHERWVHLYEGRAVPLEELVSTVPAETTSVIRDAAREYLERHVGRSPVTVPWEDPDPGSTAHATKLLSSISEGHAQIWKGRAWRPRSWTYVCGEGTTENLEDLALPDFIDAEDAERVLADLGTPVGRDPERDYDAPYWTEFWGPGDEGVGELLGRLPEPSRARMVRDLEDRWGEDVARRCLGGLDRGPRGGS